MTDRERAELITRSLGYRTTVPSVDKGKVERAKFGIPSPLPKSLLALVAYDLYINSPPLSAPLAPPWRLDGVYTIGLSSFTGAKRQAAWAAGYRAVYVQLMHTLDGAAQANELEIPVFRREGWQVSGWATYGQGTDPLADGREAAAIARRLGLAGWRANGEAWAEGGLAWKTAAFLEGWNEGGAPCPLGWSVLSSDTANFARSFDYGTALSVDGADIDLQVYGSIDPGYTVHAGLGMLAQVKPAPVPVNRTTMTFSVNNAGAGPFPDYRTWAGPRRVWTGDAAQPTTFQQLAR